MLAGCRVAVITDLLTVTAPTKSPSWLPTMDACEPESKAAVPVKVRRRVNEWVTDRGARDGMPTSVRRGFDPVGHQIDRLALHANEAMPVGAT